MSSFINTTLTSFTLNIVSSTAELISLLISISFLFFIIYRFLHIKYHYGQVNISIPVILSLNTLCLLIVKSIIQLLDVNLNALRRDLSLVTERNDSIFCRLRGYIYFSVVSALYWSFALQAIFRFLSVLYPRCLQLYRSTRCVCGLIFAQMILAFSSILPHLLLFDGMQLIPDEIYCTAVMNDFSSLIYLFLMVFGLSLGTIIICYSCIIYKMCDTSFRLVNQQRNRRDYIIIHRMMMIVAVLTVASLPATIDLIVYVPRGYLDPLIYRIEWISASVNALICTISLPFVNPQLCELFKERQVPQQHVIKLEVTKKTMDMQSL